MMNGIEPPAAGGLAVDLGRRRVGDGHPVCVVAEAGVNHDGRRSRALDLVSAAHSAGADAVKFQVFRADSLVAGEARTAGYQRKGDGAERQSAMLRRLELSDGDLHAIRNQCDALGIIMLATPFSPEDVDRLDALDVPAIKIASTDLTNRPLLDRVLETRRPLIVSTGASTAVEIHQSVTRLKSAGAGRRLILLHCVSCYPTPLESANLRAVMTLREAFDVPVGFSDHTLSEQAGAWAVMVGGCLVEKHLTLDPGGPGPDHAISLDPVGFTRYVAEIRRARTALGSGTLGYSPMETEVRSLARRSVVAGVDIAPGTRLGPEHLVLKRPGTGLPVESLDQVLGRVAAVTIRRDTLLTWDMLS